MKHALVVALLAFVATQAYAKKSCVELKAEIAAKLEAASVKSYSLEIVETEKVGDAKVVGSCDGGKKKITYAKK